MNKKSEKTMFFEHSEKCRLIFTKKTLPRVTQSFFIIHKGFLDTRNNSAN